MEPSKPEGVSRHSSILKLPKQRQPLQCVIANPSSSESSPTVKIKRRVSFAKNRRIREFCNEAENETVWDNTYEEEHDLSSTKNSNNSTEQALIISVPCDDKENFPVQLFMKNSELECREVSTNIPSEEGNNLEQYEMEMDASINASEPIIQMQNQKAEIPNMTIYCDDGMDITLNIPTNIIPCHDQNETLEDTVLVSRNNTQDATNITENMSLNLLNKLEQYKNLDTKSACNSTDLTQAISLLLKPGSANKTMSGIDAVSTSHFKESCDDKTMEFTSILPSSTWLKPDSKCQNVEKIENFTTRTMEFTLAVPNSNILRNKIQNETSCLSEKTNIFSAKSMEMTEAIPTKPVIKTVTDAKKLIEDKSKVFPNIFMKMTEVIPTNKMHQTSINVNNVVLNTMQEKTNIFINKSTEITQSVPLHDFATSTQKLSSPQEMQNKSNIFADVPMEMTEILPIINKLSQFETTRASPNLSHEQRKVFTNKYMEITGVVPINSHQNETKLISNASIKVPEATPFYHNTNNGSRKTVDDNQGKIEVPCNRSSEMTEVTGTYKTAAHPLLNNTNNFVDKTMDFTEAVSVYRTVQQSKVNTDFLGEKTNIFVDKSMEITEAVPINNKVEITEAVPQHMKIQQPNALSKTIGEKTNIFVNQSMEMTQAIPLHMKIQQPNALSKTIGEKTNIFANQSMEMTEAVPLHMKLQQPTVLSKTIDENTNIFANQSMEMTEAVPLHMKLQQPTVLSKTISEKTNIFANQSMEMTEAVPLHMKLQHPTVLSKTIGEKTNIFANQSMEMTEAVPLHMKIQQPNALSKTIGEKTNIFANQSMEMTEAVPLHMKLQQPTVLSKTIGEKTNIFANQSMEMTEAVPLHMKIQQPNALSKTIGEKTNIFANQSMEMTEAVPRHMKLQQPNALSKTIDENTNIFANQSMEMTEAVPLHMKLQQPTVLSKTISEKTNIFANQSMEMTEAVPLHMKLQHPTVLSKTIGEKTNIFANQSMEMTEAVPLHMKIQQPNALSKTISEKTNIFANQSMEMTEAVPLHMKLQQPTILSKTIGEKTNIFANQSMEMTEAVPLHMKIQQPNALSKTIGEKTNIFANQSMEMTEAVPRHMKLQQPNALSKTIDENTNIFANQSMEMTEAVPLHMKLQQPTVLSKTISEKTNIFANQSMEMTEAVPLHMKLQQPTVLSKTIGEKTNIFANQSMEMTEAVPPCLSIPKSIINAPPLNDIINKKNSIFTNNSMDMTAAFPIYDDNISKMQCKSPQRTSICIKSSETSKTTIVPGLETIPVVKRINEINVDAENCNNEKTECYLNKSMDITEAAPKCSTLSNKVMEEETKMFLNTSMNITETIDSQPKMTLASNQCKQNNIQEKTKVFMDKSMEMTDMIATYKNYPSPNMQLEKAAENKATQMFPNSSKELAINMSNMLPARNSNSNSLNENVDNRQSKNNNDFMEMTTELPISKTTVRDLTTRHKNDNELQKTEISRKRSRDFDSYYEPKRNLQDVELSRMLPISMNPKNDLNTLNHYNNQSISSKKLDDIQRTGHVSNYDRGNDHNTERLSFREETVHRLTSDELNTLCASINLPSQKYSKDESMNTPNNYNSSCNDINVLRASLEKNNLFQQSDSTHKNNRMSEKAVEKNSKNSGESIKKRNIFGAIPSTNTKENLNQPQEKLDRIPVPMEVSEIHKHSTNKFSVFEDNNELSLQTDVLCKSITTPLTAMETEKTAELNLKQPENQHSYYNPSKSLQTNLLLSNTGNLQNLSQSRDKTNNLHVSVNVSTVHGYPVNESITVHQSFGHSNHKVSDSCTTTRMSIDIENDAAAQTDLDHSKWPSSKIQIYHDSMEVAPVSSKLPIPKKKFDFRETEEFINRNNNTASNTVGSAHTLVKICNKENNENRLIKLPSDNTDVLLATSGCKTETPCPAVINEETVIKISSRSLIGKTYVLNADSKIGQVEKNKTFVVTTDSKIECQPESNKTFVLNTNSKLESQINPNKTFVVTANSNIENQVETNKTYVVSKSTDKITQEESKLTSNLEQNVMRSDTKLREHAIDISSIESKESSLMSNLLQEKFSNELDEIEPPSFLYSNSMHENTNESVLKSNDLNSSNNLSKHDPIILSPETKENVKVNRSPDCKQISRKTEKYEKDNTLSEIKNNVKCKEATKKNKMKKIAKSECEVEVIQKPIEEPVEEPLSPFESLTEDLRKHEKSDECIWQIRTITLKTVAIDFITKSFVVIIRLNEFEKACIKDIENIEIISLLRSDSKNTLLKIIHNLLLAKIKPSELLEKYKMYEDILPLLDYISSEVLFAMKFKFDLERLSALNLMNVDHERISFMVASRKTNIILKVSLVLKVFNNIGPDDIDVICVLGDIRKNDIKQLIVNIRRDYKFLSRYIKDVKDYITLMEDSTYRFKGQI